MTSSISPADVPHSCDRREHFTWGDWLALTVAALMTSSVVALVIFVAVLAIGQHNGSAAGGGG